MHGHGGPGGHGPGGFGGFPGFGGLGSGGYVTSPPGSHGGPANQSEAHTQQDPDGPDLEMSHLEMFFRFFGLPYWRPKKRKSKQSNKSKSDQPNRPNKIDEPSVKVKPYAPPKWVCYLFGIDKSAADQRFKKLAGQPVKPVDLADRLPERVRITSVTYGVLVLLFGLFMVISNLLAAKIWQLNLGILGAYNFDGGLITFPIVYVIGDVLTVIYGEKMSNRVTIWVCIVNVFCLFSFSIVNWLPDAPGADNVAFSAAFGLSSRIIMASIVGFFVSRLVNNRFLTKWLSKYGYHKKLARNTWLSSLLGRIPDAFLFNFLAFAGRGELTYKLLILQAITAIVAGTIVETFLTPIKTRLCHWLRTRVLY